MENYNELIKEGMTVEEITGLVEKVAQSSADKVRTKYSQGKKQLEGQLATQSPFDSEEFVQMKSQLNELKSLQEAENRRKALKEAKLPETLADVLNGSLDTDTIAKLSEAFNSHALATGYVPAGANGQPQGVINKSDFRKMTYTERVNLMNTNPDLYNALAK